MTTPGDPASALRRSAATWQALGADDPLWAVLSTQEGRDGAWDEESFLRTGAEHVDYARRLALGCGARFAGRALDFGCGVGRLTRALVATPGVESAVGVDVAESMVRRAQRLHHDVPGLRFVHNVSAALPFDDASIDVVLSLLVLQHVPAALSVRYLLEFARVLRPGGTMVVQIPSEPALPEALPSAGARAGLAVTGVSGRMAPGSIGELTVLLTNTGTATWTPQHAIRVANHWVPAGGGTEPGAGDVIRDDGRADLPHQLRPGEQVPLRLRVKAPDRPGRWRLQFDVVQEFVAWWSDLGSPMAELAVEVADGGDPPGTSGALSAATDPAPADSAPADPAPADPAPGRTEPAASASASASDGDRELRPVSDSSISMYPVPRTLVRALMEHVGCWVAAAEPDELAGPGWTSFTYVIRR